MKNNILLIAVIAVISVCAILYDIFAVNIVEVAQNKPSQTYSKEIYIQAPDLIVTDLDGVEINLSELKGHVVLLNFWASWCLPCAHEFPSMLNLLNKFDGQVKMLAISVDSKKTNIERFIKKIQNKNAVNLVNKNLHIIWDKHKNIAQDGFGVLKLPETIIIDAGGFMVRKIVGGDLQWDGKDMMQYISSLLISNQSKGSI